MSLGSFPSCYIHIHNNLLTMRPDKSVSLIMFIILGKTSDFVY